MITKNVDCVFFRLSTFILSLQKAPVFITSQNTKEDEIVIEEKPKEVKIITPEITDIK